MVHFLLKHEITTTYIPEVLVKMQMGGMDPLAQTPPQSSPIPSQGFQNLICSGEEMSQKIRIHRVRGLKFDP